MGNLSGSFNKFLKNKNTVTILGVIACLVILYAGYNMRINAKTNLVDVYYANQTIQPKTLITEDMVSKTSVPASFILGAYYKNYNDIVGKYSNYNTLIAAGSLFYSDLLTEEANLPDAVFYDVNEGEKVVAHAVDVASTYGNSIMPGNIVDVYASLLNDEGEVVYGQFFENVEILAVKDVNGRNVFENTNEERTPAYVYFSLPEAKYLLYKSMGLIQSNYSDYEIGLSLVPNTIEFNAEDPTATKVSSSYLYDFVLDNLETIDNQEELYNELLNEMEQQELEQEQQNTTTDDNETTEE